MTEGASEALPRLRQAIDQLRLLGADAQTGTTPNLAERIWDVADDLSVLWERQGLAALLSAGGSAPLPPQGPTAGDLLVRAIDRWALHANECESDECDTCAAHVNQLRLAHKVWQSSHHQRVSAAPRVEPLTFEQLRDTNKARCEAAFHQVDAWKPWEWSNAMAGECGEACNLTKKMNRIWPANQFKQNWNKPDDQRMAELEGKLADEIADVVIYADLLATCIGRSLGDCVRDKFNEKSDEIGSSIKLPTVVPPPVGGPQHDNHEGTCNPFRATCGAKFCTYEEMAEHEHNDNEDHEDLQARIESRSQRPDQTTRPLDR